MDVDLNSREIRIGQEHKAVTPVPCPALPPRVETREVEVAESSILGFTVYINGRQSAIRLDTDGEQFDRLTTKLARTTLGSYNTVVAVVTLEQTEYPSHTCHVSNQGNVQRTWLPTSTTLHSTTEPAKTPQNQQRQAVLFSKHSVDNQCRMFTPVGIIACRRKPRHTKANRFGSSRIEPFP